MERALDYQVEGDLRGREGDLRVGPLKSLCSRTASNTRTLWRPARLGPVARRGQRRYERSGTRERVTYLEGSGQRNGKGGVMPWGYQ